MSKAHRTKSPKSVSRKLLTDDELADFWLVAEAAANSDGRDRELLAEGFDALTAIMEDTARRRRMQ